MRLLFRRRDQMHDVMAVRFEVVGEETAMTLPPQQLGAHDGGPLLGGMCLQTRDALLELACLHVIGITAETGVLPGGVVRVLARRTPPTKLRKMFVSNSLLLQGCRKRVLREVGMPPRGRKASNISDERDVMRDQRREKCPQRLIRMPDSPDLHMYQVLRSKFCVLSSAGPARDGDEEPAFAMAGNHLTDVHDEPLEDAAESFWLEQLLVVLQLGKGHGLRNRVDEFEASLLQPTDDFANCVFRLVRVLVMIHEPRAALLCAHACVRRVAIEEQHRVVCRVEHYTPDVGRETAVGVIEANQDVPTRAHQLRNRLEAEHWIAGVV